MKRAAALILSIIAIGILLGFVFEPFATIIAGMVVWIILWLAQGGMHSGSPHKNTFYAGNKVIRTIADKDIDPVADYTSIFLFLTGALLIVIGLIWMKLNGADFT